MNDMEQQVALITPLARPDAGVNNPVHKCEHYSTCDVPTCDAPRVSAASVIYLGPWMMSN